MVTQCINPNCSCPSLLGCSCPSQQCAVQLGEPTLVLILSPVELFETLLQIKKWMSGWVMSTCGKHITWLIDGGLSEACRHNSGQPTVAWVVLQFIYLFIAPVLLYVDCVLTKHSWGCVIPSTMICFWAPPKCL